MARKSLAEISDVSNNDLKAMLMILLMEAHSKSQCNKIVAWVGHDEQRFDVLVHLFLNGHALTVQRAGWPLSFIGIQQPELVMKHLPALVNNLQKPKLHNSVKRHTARLLQFITIPETEHGLVMDICFRFVTDPAEAIAVKAFSLSVLENLANIYPEIKEELKLVIEERLPYETAAFSSRAKKILKRL